MVRELMDAKFRDGQNEFGPGGNLRTLDTHIKEINRNTHRRRGATHHQFHQFSQDMFSEA